jgi:hypothetical protein
MNAEAAELDRLYALLPRVNRGELHARLVANQNFETVADPDTAAGRYFIIAVGNFPAPAAQMPLSDIIREIEPDAQFYGYKIRIATDILLNYLEQLGIIDHNINIIMNGGKNRKSRRSRRSHRSRKNRSRSRKY